MTDRMYRAILGFSLLLVLTLDLELVLYFIILILFFEGITDIRVPMLICRLRNCLHNGANPVEYSYGPFNTSYRFNINSERVWRLFVALLLTITFYFYNQLWFFPWFMGFAIFGAGVSGVCPMLIAVRWIGFK